MFESILRYKTAMAVFKRWHAQGAITMDDLRLINKTIAAKYGLSLSSIYLDHT